MFHKYEANTHPLRTHGETWRTWNNDMKNRSRILSNKRQYEFENGVKPQRTKTSAGEYGSYKSKEPVVRQSMLPGRLSMRKTRLW